MSAIPINLCIYQLVDPITSFGKKMVEENDSFEKMKFFEVRS